MLEYAIYTKYAEGEIDFLEALGNSLNILNIRNIADLLCIVSPKIPRPKSSYWTMIDGHSGEEVDNFDLLIPLIRDKYKKVIYVDIKTIFLENPKVLFSFSGFSTFFSSMKSNLYWAMYADILNWSTDPMSKSYSIGHLHAYGNLKNGTIIDSEILKLVVSGKYSDGSWESLPNAPNFSLFVLSPDPAAYRRIMARFKQDGIPDLKNIVGGERDSFALHAFFPEIKIWRNLMYNYRIPQILLKKGKIVHRENRIIGLTDSEIPMYSCEATQELAKKVLKLRSTDMHGLSNCLFRASN